MLNSLQTLWQHNKSSHTLNTKNKLTRKIKNLDLQTLHLFILSILQPLRFPIALVKLKNKNAVLKVN